jgi:predicted  nucleic acid-binding Zn-ribbon protein
LNSILIKKKKPQPQPPLQSIPKLKSQEASLENLMGQSNQTQSDFEKLTIEIRGTNQKLEEMNQKLEEKMAS